MSIVTALRSKPYYIFRPDQIARRIGRRLRRTDQIIVSLPWGARLAVDRRDLIGSGIARTSSYELPVSEAMWRIAAQARLAVDVGANVGYFTALLSARARDVAFEPHPAIAEKLAANVQLMTRGDVVIRRCAVSDTTATAQLGIPAGFAANQETAGIGVAAEKSVVVNTVRLDDIIGVRTVDVMKVDVEGHELAALTGAEVALSEGRIRNIFFEDHHRLPTPVSELLASRGYEIFGLAERFRGVALTAPDGLPARWHAPTYLATCEPVRALRLIRPDGWNSLRPRRGA